MLHKNLDTKLADSDPISDPKLASDKLPVAICHMHAIEDEQCLSLTALVTQPLGNRTMFCVEPHHGTFCLFLERNAEQIAGNLLSCQDVQ